MSERENVKNNNANCNKWNLLFVRELSEKMGVKFKYVKQMPIKNGSDYLLHIIVKNTENKKLFICALAFNELQKFRLRSSQNCIKFIKNSYSKYFLFNEPLWYGVLQGINAEIVIYRYYSDAKRIDRNSRIPIEVMDKIYEECDEVKVTGNLLQQISNSILQYNFPKYSHEAVLRNKFYYQYMEALSKMDTVKLTSQHLDYSPSNILCYQNKLMLIDFEQGAEHIPIGYDKLHYMLYQKNVEVDNIPYYHLNEYLYGIFHIPKHELCQEKYTPSFIINIDDVIIDECSKETSIYMKHIRGDVIFLDFEKKFIEPYSYFKLIDELKKKYSYIIVANSIWNLLGSRRGGCVKNVEVFLGKENHGKDCEEKIKKSIIKRYWTYECHKLMR